MTTMQEYGMLSSSLKEEEKGINIVRHSRDSSKSYCSHYEKRNKRLSRSVLVMADMSKSVIVAFVHYRLGSGMTMPAIGGY